jgi:LmbE family N-acetylglucosaminyl deacetylase
MDWIFLSPHFDDAALSCGGLIWSLGQQGSRVEVWTICAGDMPSGPYSAFAEELHARWKTGAEAVALRRQEDRESCRRMGAALLWLDLPDCIYRTGPNGEYLYASREAIFGALHPLETRLVQDVAAQLALTLPPGVNVVAPLTLGNHVDHQLTRRAAGLAGLGSLYYYADYPYVAQDDPDIAARLPQGAQAQHFELSEAALEAWAGAVAAHASQISSFWKDGAEMTAALQAYYARQGTVLWKAG